MRMLGWFKRSKRRKDAGFLQRLRADVRGNTIAIMAAAILPMIALMGGALDMSRIYLVKTRLQQACDAGALAGRKVMGGGSWSANNNAANTAAEQFFTANYKTNAYGTTGLTKTYGESGGKVVGNATVVVPMTLMKVFAMPDRTITVACDAEMRLPNTDVMFVLDNTGSMACETDGSHCNSGTNSKIVTLRHALKCFYETVAKIDTTENCGSTPTGGVGSQVQLRFGFVPYSTNVNVGKLLPTSYFPDTWWYQSRKAFTTTQTNSSTTQGTPTVINTTQGPWSGWSTTGYNYNGNYYDLAGQYSGNCSASKTPRDTDDPGLPDGSESAPTNPSSTPSGNTIVVKWTTTTPYRDYDYENYNTNNTCYYGYRTRTTWITKTYQRIDTVTTTTQTVFDHYHYGRTELNISGLKNGTNWNSSVSLPIGYHGADATVTWDGCIEERKTAYHASYSPIPSDAFDLDIDMVPTASVDTQWKPALPGTIFLRRAMASETNLGTAFASLNGDEVDTADEYKTDVNGIGLYSCPRQAMKLTAFATASPFESYVNSLTTTGNTYHDIGLLWGARFLSPTGIFRSENEFTPQGGEIQRHLVFMTDGETNTSVLNYAAYGMPYYDRRQQSSTGNPPSDNDTNDQVNARFTALCEAIRNKNITLWVVYFGTTDNATEQRMRTCAGATNRFFLASDPAALNTAFNAIATQITQLRLTR